jgi:hypothetical protein
MFALQGRSRYPRSLMLALGVVVAAFAAAATSVRADVRVGGTSGAVRIETQNASVAEILGALGGAFGVHYRSAVGLEKQLSGTYEGPLQAVVARVLDGYSFVVKSSGGSLEITVIGTRNAGAPGAAPPSFDWKAASTPPAAQAPSAAPVAQAPSAAPAAQAPSAPPAVQAPGRAPAANDEGLPPSAAPSPALKLADGSTPPMPIPAQGQGPLLVPELQPSSVAPPTPSPADAAKIAAPAPQASEVPPPNPETAAKPIDGAPPKGQ